uniref:ZP domain-containing protein n=1 Tax=Panagrolaimus sp. ES5 TaxID=591445 RepID=A0AC34EZW8_9BILA
MKLNFRVFYGFILIFVSQNLVKSQRGFEIDNGLIGVPDIQCNSDTIELRFKTKKKFTGKIFVQGHYGNPECKVDYGQVAKDGRPVGGIKLSHGACDMDRQRMVG